MVGNEVDGDEWEIRVVNSGSVEDGESLEGCSGKWDAKILVLGLVDGRRRRGRHSLKWIIFGAGGLMVEVAELGCPAYNWLFLGVGARWWRWPSWGAQPTIGCF